MFKEFDRDGNGWLNESEVTSPPSSGGGGAGGSPGGAPGGGVPSSK